MMDFCDTCQQDAGRPDFEVPSSVYVNGQLNRVVDLAMRCKTCQTASYYLRPLELCPGCNQELPSDGGKLFPYIHTCPA